MTWSFTLGESKRQLAGNGSRRGGGIIPPQACSGASGPCRPASCLASPTSERVAGADSFFIEPPDAARWPDALAADNSAPACRSALTSISVAQRHPVDAL